MAKRQFRRSWRNFRSTIANAGEVATNFFRSQSSYAAPLPRPVPPIADSDNDDGVFEPADANESDDEDNPQDQAVRLPCEICQAYFAPEALMIHQRVCERQRRSQRRRSNPRSDVRRIASESGLAHSTAPSAPTRSRSPSPTEGFEAPPDLLCPITRSLFRDPVSAPDGHTYEREAILRCLRTQQRSPITRQTIRVEQLNPNLVVKNLADNFRNECRQKRALFRFRYDVDLVKGRELNDPTRLKHKREYYIQWLKSQKGLDKTNTILVHVTGPNAEKYADVHRHVPIHPHLVRTHGVVEHSESGALVVQEFAPLCSLTEMLDKTKSLSSQMDLIFHQIANGLKCLSAAGIPHGHLNSDSILIYKLDSALENTLIKIKNIADYLIFERPEEDPDGPEIAPEILTDRAYSEKSDVFAFGALARQVYPSTLLDAARNELFAQCQAKDPQARPTFEHIVSTFSQWLHKEHSDEALDE